MSSAPAFSRLQLAAALLEYDNDPTNPNAPLTRAQDSAIFAHFRRNPAAPPRLSSRKSDYLGVSLPTETGSLGGRESLLDNRRSRASRGSLHTLRNPFGPEDYFSGEEESNEDEELEVDLASWGLDSLIPREKGKSAKGKAKAVTPPPHAVPSHFPLTSDSHTTFPKRAINTSRSVSLGGIAEYPGMNNLSDASRRRKSFASPLDFAGMEVSQFPVQRPRRLSHPAVQRPSSSASQSLPFPSSSARSPSPHLQDQSYGRRVSVGSRFEPKQSTIEGHKFSRVSTEMMLQDELEGLPYDLPEQAAGNPFAVRPPSPSRLSRFDPKATSHVRTYSSGSKLPPEQDGMLNSSQDSPKRERKFSTTVDLLRPKVLVMPSPLQPVTPDAPPLQTQVRDGFLLSTDGPPLPPGARSSRHISTIVTDLANKPPVASNSFTPNPLMNLSLSQMTFRNTLHVGGQQDPYSEIVAGLPRATEDGEQIEFSAPERDSKLLPPNASAGIGTDHARPAGKLFGKSLIDDLEMRKAQLRSKQRVFTGDQRPSMMSRQLTRSSTLIDPASLGQRPTTQRQSVFGGPESCQLLSHRNSLTAKPLLNFDDEGDKFTPTTSRPRMISSRSVFGVDTLWERETAKLREIEAEEEKKEEERKKRMEQEEQKKKRKKRKLKKRGLEDPNTPLDAEASRLEVEPRVSIEPPILPNIARATRRPQKATEDDDDDDDDDESDDQDGLAAHAPADDAGKWFSDSDEEGPRRTTGVGPRYPNQRQRAPKIENNDSDEDLPLSMAVSKAAQQAAARLQQPDDSDEEKPLSSLMQKQRENNSPIKTIVDDDDDKPLGLHASTVANHLPQGDDDDMPLAFHPQQRRTQYQMFTQQQQQQQLMMQTQFHNSMFFGPPSMYGSGFFAPPVIPAMSMMMQPSIPMPSPPPVQDVVKFGRVDKWRHDVAVEGNH